MEDTPSSWNTLPEELKHHTLSFVETYTPEYAAARLVCAEWSHSLKALPKRPLLFYDDIVQSSDSLNEQYIEYLKALSWTVITPLDLESLVR